jgi:uncharacterized protein (DUF433 family)
MDWMQTDREILHGTPCFAGTRVPVKSLFDHLLHGYTLEYFLEQFPSVRREHAESALKSIIDHLPQQGVSA